MTRAQVLLAVQAGVRQAFDLGVKQGKAGGTGKPHKEQQRAAMLYALALVEPKLDAALDQAVEEGYAAARRVQGAVQ